MTKETDKVVAVGNAELPEEKQVENKNRDEHGRLLPGHTANPNGRPKKGYSITETFREMFEKDPKKKAELASTIFAKAMQGDIAAMKLLWNYMDGMPMQGVELTGKDGAPVDHNISLTFK